MTEAPKKHLPHGNYARADYFEQECGRLRERIVFLEEQIRHEQHERVDLQYRYDIIDARYKQIEGRWHKLMERTDLQCRNRLGNQDGTQG